MKWLLVRLNRSYLPLLVSVVLSTLLLSSIYAGPLAVTRDIGSDGRYVPGLYKGERNAAFSYAYTDGDAFITIPQTGVGTFVVEMRLGGPLGRIPLVASLRMPSQQLSLGHLDRVRVAHILVPADRSGNVRLNLQSTTTSPGSEGRALGVLLDWVHLRSVTGSMPPVSTLLSTLVLLVLMSTICTRRKYAIGNSIAVLLVTAGIVCGSYAVFRGELHIEWLWIAGICLAGAGLLLWRLDNWHIRLVPRRVTALFLGTPLRRVVSLFVTWRVALWILAALGLWYRAQLTPLAEHISGQVSPAKASTFLSSVLIHGWSQWDSGYYQSIATNGYAFTREAQSTIAFFPLYPLLMRVLLPLAGGSAEIAGLLISHVSLLIALYLLYDVLTHDFGSQIAYRALILVLLFPTSIFFVAVYSEALALALLAAVLWATRRHNWWVAGVAGGLLALTRLPGILITPVLLVSYFACYGWKWRAMRPSLLATLLPIAGILLFMLYQWWRFGSPLAFLIAQEAWDQRMSPPWTMLWRTLTAIRNSKYWLLAVFQVSTWIAFVVLTAVSLRRLPVAYSLTGLFLLLPAYASNHSGSLPRYVLLGVPCFVLLAIYTEQLWLRRLVVAVILPLLAVATLLFVNGYWVA